MELYRRINWLFSYCGSVLDVLARWENLMEALQWYYMVVQRSPWVPSGNAQHGHIARCSPSKGTCFPECCKCLHALWKVTISWYKQHRLARDNQKAYSHAVWRDSPVGQVLLMAAGEHPEGLWGNAMLQVLRVVWDKSTSGDLLLAWKEA